MIDSVEATLGIYAATLIVAALSGFIPVINAELYLVAVTLVTDSLPLAILLGVIVAIGQMIAKVGIYQASRGATTLGKGGKLEAKLAKARALVERWRGKPLTLIFVSATVGIPPFFVVSILAGLLELRFRAFLLVGLLGRTVRFVTISLLALLA